MIIKAYYGHNPCSILDAKREWGEPRQSLMGETPKTALPPQDRAASLSHFGLIFLALTLELYNCSPSFLDAVAHGGNHGSRSWGKPPRPRCLPKTALHRFLILMMSNSFGSKNFGFDDQSFIWSLIKTEIKGILV
ncbi:hypothetical protein LYNGBM3L_41610 [Moorena producens 3L]|uniref:Uncharacterized protein n=1 Tax=Moorena producens 3L TaxID=489825 RepID=F4XVI4_9CYAN|nr:hypothetical protein [Moorena producens]EGJ31247.1 hypothetical protein LYNGBM3L_41610 [Moorena producens 3L]OLT66332.1 hypothetical protein BI334_16080 [Moorena producens 3L]